jgi:hypothetical protein
MRVSAAIAGLFGACCKGEENALFVPTRALKPSFSQTEADGWRDRICYLPSLADFRVCRAVRKMDLNLQGITIGHAQTATMLLSP